jgi:Fe-S oxidoreductase
LRDTLPGAARLSELAAGFSARRKLPKWRNDVFREDIDPSCAGLDGRVKSGHEGEIVESAREVVLFADTFNRYFERENLDAALQVLRAAGYHVRFAQAERGSRPLCCGRTFLAVGAVQEAREEAERTLKALMPFVARGVPILGIEPSCIFGFRDEAPALLKREDSRRLAQHAFLLEEFLAREAEAGRLQLPLKNAKGRALLHGHCHQKAFGAMSAVEQALKLIPGLEVQTVDSSCCGMAGSFGYAADTIDVSLAMGELSLLPAVRDAAPETLIVADGVSCREQIAHGAGRTALHVARVLAAHL